MLDIQHRYSRISPYGDPGKWDLLWLRRCGAGFPRPPVDNELATVGRHNVLLAVPKDPTVPMPKYLRSHPVGSPNALGKKHPPHTRVYHRASGGALCTVAYAVNQWGARRLLRDFGLKKGSRIWDVEMGDWWAGEDFTGISVPVTLPTSQEQLDSENFAAEYEFEIPMPAAVGGGSVRSVGKRDIMTDGKKKGQRGRITSQPPIFAHYHSVGGGVILVYSEVVTREVWKRSMLD